MITGNASYKAQMNDLFQKVRKTRIQNRLLQIAI